MQCFFTVFVATKGRSTKSSATVEDPNATSNAMGAMMDIDNYKKHIHGDLDPISSVQACQNEHNTAIEKAKATAS